MGSSPTIRIELNRKNAGNSRVSGFYFYSDSLYGTFVGQIVFYSLSKLSTVVPKTATSFFQLFHMSFQLNSYCPVVQKSSVLVCLISYYIMRICVWCEACPLAGELREPLFCFGVVEFHFE